MLRDYQTEGKYEIYRHWQSGAKNVMLVFPTGAGKCLAPDTPVLKFDGTIARADEITRGDLLMGPDSRERTVLSTCQGREELFRVTPVKGDSYVVNRSHILSVKMTGGYSGRKGAVAGDTINLSIDDYLRESATFRHCAKGWRTGINFTGSLAVDDIEPYMLGLWLGDGSSRHLAITSADPEIWAEVAAFAGRHHLLVRYEFNSLNSLNLHVIEDRKVGSTGRGGGQPNRWLRAHGLLRNKHIPHRYKTADRKTRLEVLAGIIDTDGSLSHGGFDLVLKSEQLFDDVLFVARSLGFACYKKPTRKTCSNNGVTGDYFRCAISGDVAEVPCRLPRKRANPRRQIKDVLLTGIRVESIGVGDYAGFELDGDRLFLLGDFTVTHNTVTFADIISEYQGASCAIAHRQELVSQISIALGREGVRHSILAPQKTVRAIVNMQMDELGRSYFDPNARCRVAGIDTLVRHDPKDPWLQQVGLWVNDEGHHVLKANKWGKGVGMFPNASGLLVTATPLRADGKGLGRDSDGVADAMVVGPTMRELIDRKFLTPYRIFAPPNDLDLSDVGTSAGGDFSPKPLRKAVHRSQKIVGDVVQHYLKIAKGKLGVTFAVDIAAATEIATAFRAAGVPAEVVSSDTPDALRLSILRRFRKREILQLVNVDLFGEGFDLPAIEVVSFARPTQSYALYCQQFGRALRLLDGKLWALIIDHVGNVYRHGLPDARRDWSLDRRERSAKKAPIDLEPIRVCLACAGAYERLLGPVCPYCGVEQLPAGRSTPAQVEGDLFELDPEVLARMRGEIEKIDQPPYLGHLDGLAAAGLQNRHYERQQAQAALRSAIMEWGGPASVGHEPLFQRRFYLTFGIDVFSAMVLGAPQARDLEAKIRGKWA